MKQKDVQTNTVGLVIILGFVLFFYREQYWPALLSIGLLVVLLKIDTLKKLILDKELGLQAIFDIPKEKIEKDIKESKKTVTKNSFKKFKKVEETVLQKVYEKLGGKIKRQIHFVYGYPTKPEFVYTPDATIQTDKELIFLEVKYISNPILAKNIISKTLNYLQIVFEKFSPSAGKKLLIKLIVASENKIEIEDFNVPKGIDLEFFQL